MISFFLLDNRHPDILRLEAVSGKVDRVQVLLEVFDRLTLGVAEVARVEKFIDHISLKQQQNFFVAKTAKERNEKVNKGSSDLCLKH